MRALPGISGQVTHPPHHPSELFLTWSNSQRAAYKLAFRNLRGVLPVALASSAGGSVSVDAGAFARHAKDRNSPRGRFGGRRHGGVVPRPDVMALDPRLMRVRRVVQDRVHLFGNERSLFFYIGLAHSGMSCLLASRHRRRCPRKIIHIDRRTIVILVSS